MRDFKITALGSNLCYLANTVAFEWTEKVLNSRK